MNWLDRLPTLPDWVPFPRLVWFVFEGLLLGVAGFLLRDAVGRSSEVLVTLGNVVIIVGFVTALIGALAWVALVAVNR